MKIRFKSVILVVVLIGVVILSACDISDTTDTLTEHINEQIDAAEGIDDSDVIVDDVDPRQAILDMWSYPDVDFDGHEFSVLIRGVEGRHDYFGSWDSRDIFSEGETGEVLNDAVFRRNVEVEEALGITIVPIMRPTGDQPALVQRAVAAGDNSFCAVMMSFEHLTNSAQQGMFMNLDDLLGIDLSFPWWDQSLLRDTSVMNRNFFATGDITVMTHDGTWTMMFNKQVHHDHGLPNIYDIVRAGEWTVEKMLELGRDVSADLDGSGVMTPNDRWALTTTWDTVPGLFFSMGNRITRKDEHDLPTFALYGDHLLSSLDKIFEVMSESNNFTLTAGHLTVQAVFEEDRALFLGEVMQLVIRLRQMETDFGVIPLPKFDQYQERYLTTIHQMASVGVAIPVGIEDAERSATILEALAYGGFKFIRPAYYYTALVGQMIRDYESEEMLDIIFAGRVADLGRMNHLGGVIGAINSNMQNNNPAFASTIERLERILQRDIERVIQRIMDLD